MLSEDQFLPGTEGMKPAEPWEQTESQFQKRPDVFVHGRYVDTRKAEPGVLPDYKRGEFPEPWNGGDGFHAGTQRAAEERLDSLGPAYKDTSPRFYYGRVDPQQMKNKPETGTWEMKLGAGDRPSSRLPYTGPNQGRVHDFGEEWRPEDHSQYYRNDFEDKGSTSVILPMEYTKGTRDHPSPKNFTSWRDEVTAAMQSGKRVPRHVHAAYGASGGAEGSDAYVDTRFDAIGKGRDRMFSPMWTQASLFQLRDNSKDA